MSFFKIGNVSIHERCPYCGNDTCSIHRAEHINGRFVGRVSYGCGADQEMLEDGSLVVHRACAKALGSNEQIMPPKGE